MLPCLRVSVADWDWKPEPLTGDPGLAAGTAHICHSCFLKVRSAENGLISPGLFRSRLKETQPTSLFTHLSNTHKLQDGRQVIRGSEGQREQRPSGVIHQGELLHRHTSRTGPRGTRSSSVVSDKCGCPSKCLLFFFFFLGFAPSGAVSDSQVNFELGRKQ